MKRILCCLICLVMLFLFVGCNSNTTPVLSGVYYVKGDFEEGLTPYVSLSLDDNTFSMGAGSLFSFAANDVVSLVMTATPNDVASLMYRANNASLRMK